MRPMNYSTSSFFLLSLLWVLGSWAVGGQTPVQAEPHARTAEPASLAADSLLLDQYPDAYAGYSLRRLRAEYDGPAIRVRRESDNAVQDFGFTDEGELDIAAIENWLSGADGAVVRWYSQVDGASDLTATGTPPKIATSGTVYTDSDGLPRLYFSGGGLSASGFSISANDVSVFMVQETDAQSGEFNTLFDFDNNLIRLYAQSAPTFWLQGDEETGRTGDGTRFKSPYQEKNFLIAVSRPEGMAVYQNDAALFDTEEVVLVSSTASTLTVGTSSGGAWAGYMSEVVVYGGMEEEGVWGRYDNGNAYWKAGPTGTNRDALLPQRRSWQITLYDWLETLSVEDVTLPDGTLTYDNSYESEDELADVWLKTRGLTASSVTRRSPDWYLLDNGSGKGIEATGVVRANHNPKGDGDYGGNPPRSWQNEPAYWYKMDLPLAGGGQGNPWHEDPAMGRRAMVVSIVDLMMHQGLDDVSAYNWYDMKGKAFLGMAEAYRWAGDVLPSGVQEAYESGMEGIVDDLTTRGPRAVNTNMDMFALHGAADLYMATDDAALQQKCVEMVKAALFGFTDGKLGTNHKVFAAGGGQNGGVFDPSGFIMEGDQPDVFYGGESIHHLAGALEAVTDRETGSVSSDWSFLEEVVRRLQEWRTYQMFYDPGVSSEAIGGTFARTFVTAGSGFSGRTSASVPGGQADGPWKKLSIAARYPDHAFKGWVPSISSMESGIANKLSAMNGEMSSNYSDGQPEEWKGWSPWTKHTPYLPPEGWYGDLKSLKNAGDPKFEEPPAARKDVFWNKALGGPPTGKEYWSYKQEDENGEAFGFFVEAQARQGQYGGWYGGKIETFWTESTGVVLLNRHGKSGCDNGYEDSTCWDNLDEKAGHHVWGRDEDGNGFTTLLLRGRNLNRTSTFDTDGSPPTVTVNNVFNDPSQPSGKKGESGEQTGSEIEGSFEVENKFEAQSDGLKVTHTLTSDQSDQVTELWASLPVYMRDWHPEKPGDKLQSGLKDTSIEYWNGSQWIEVPEDTDSDGVPEIVATAALRLGRDFKLGDGIQYTYVDFTNSQDVRRSKSKYYDPYQTMSGVQTVHVDLHGNPGTAKTLPAEKSVSYTLQTSDPTSGSTSTNQVIPLQKGWNIASTFVSPAAPAMDSVFADLQSEIVVVKNEAGEQYRPNGDINEIGQWDSEEAYLIYAKSDVVLTVHGDSLGSPSIALEQGWNWVPYYPSSSFPVEEALSSIIEDLGRVRDETGRAYLPEKDPDVLEQMNPGEGYKVYTRQATTLTYPEDGN